jgi:DHA2 family multidrug resistance protein
MTMAFIRDESFHKRDASPVDWFGLALLTAGLASVQYVLERGQHDDWFDSQTIVIMTGVAAVSLVTFIVRQLRDPHPLVDLKVFRSRSFTAGNIIGVVSGFGLWGLNLMSPLFFENVIGLDATQTGIALIPGSVATAISMPIAGRLANRLDGRASIAIGILMFAVGAWIMGYLDSDAGYWDVFWPRAIQGFALGFLFVPLMTLTLGEIPRAEMASATGVTTLIRQLGGSLGIAILQFIEQRRESSAYATLASGVTAANGNVSNLLHGSSNPGAILAQIAAMARANAQTIAYDDVFRLSAILFLAALPTVFLLRVRRGTVTATSAVALE